MACHVEKHSEAASKLNWKKCTIIYYVYLAGAGSKTGLLVWPVGLQFMFLISFLRETAS